MKHADRRNDVRKRRIRFDRLLVVFGVIAAVAFLVGTLTSNASGENAAPGREIPSEATQPYAVTAADLLLQNTADPNACAVSFSGDGILIDPILVSQGMPYSELPIPEKAGMLFGGWYTSAEAAASLDPNSRVNRARDAVCVNQRQTLNAAWVTPERAAQENTSVPILMYHQFTTKPEGENNSLYGNYQYVPDFEAQMKYLADSRAYLPTWLELDSFINSKLYLPKYSVIVTDDDADVTWLELAVPIVTKYKIMTTSFVITKWRSEGSPSPYVLQRSHSHDMHSAGGDGKGRITTWPTEDIVADLTTSGAILGAKEVLAYPFGHNNENAQRAVEAAGYLLAVTIEPGRVSPGDNPYALPRERMNFGDSLDGFIRTVSPQ